MNFGLETHQEDIQNLAKKLLKDRVTPEFLTAHEAGDTPGFDPGTWESMAEVGLLGLELSEDVGGAGLGLVESCLVLQEIGRCLAPIPYLSCIVGAAAALDRVTEGEMRAEFMDGIASGQQMVTVGLWGDGHDAPWECGVEALAGSTGWTLNGVRERVPVANVASRILVSGRTAGGEVLLFCVPLDQGSIGVECQVSTEDREVARVRFSSTPVRDRDLVARGVKAESILREMVDRMTVGACALELGMAEEALGLTARYTRTRVQFGVPIGTFQAVKQRAADAYIDVQVIRVSMLQAAWRMSRGLHCEREIAIAKYWASEAGHRVIYAAQHLHGGMGVDRDYPLYRYYLHSKRNEVRLGGGQAQLARLGQWLASESCTGPFP